MIYKIMNRIKIFISLILTVLTSIPALCQLPDGVTATDSFLDTIRNNYGKEQALRFEAGTTAINGRIPVRTIIIRNNKGESGITAAYLKTSFALANSYFRNAGLGFFIDTLIESPDYNRSYIQRDNMLKELLTIYAVPGKVNLFIVDTIRMGTERSYGYTWFPDRPDSNYIFLDKKYADGISLTTMLGHYMGLLSTHEYRGGRENADEKNCSESGDFICDTWADPGFFNRVIDSCRYIGTDRDNTGKYFVPSVANIMSDAPVKCRCVLTPGQYRRIYYYFNKFRRFSLSL